MMDADTDFQYGPQQQIARERISAWWNGDESAWDGMNARPDGAQVFRLAGYAGTGKTTLARRIVTDLGVGDLACFAAYTGKAASVLRRKGCPATTVHSLIYTPSDGSPMELRRLEEKRAAAADPGEQVALDAQIREERARLNSPAWELKANSELFDSPLLVLDEASMVNAEMAHDLMSFGARIIVLGDPAQLAPIQGPGYFTGGTPDYLLTEVHRTALDSPVLRIATTVRGAPVGDRNFGIEGPDGDSGRYGGVGIAAASRYDQVIVGSNKMRWQLIRAIRMHLKRGVDPVEGDRIIVLANSKEAAVFNGQMWTVLTCKSQGKRYLMQLMGDDGEQRELPVHTSGFTNPEGESHAVKNGRGPIVAATYAQAITCHKSQGSEFNSVLVVDESSLFGSGRYKDALRQGESPGEAARLAHEAARSWLYTAVTRASRRVHIVPTSGVKFQ